MNILKNYTFFGFLLISVLFDRAVGTMKPQLLSDLAEILSYMFPATSPFNSPKFLSSSWRIVLSTGIFFSFIAFYIWGPKPVSLKKFFKIDFISFFILFLLFLYLNSYSRHSNLIGYATVSYFSFLLLIAREQLLFNSQIMFSNRAHILWLISAISLGFFIFLHPLVLSLDRILGTFLMINLWIYTSSVQNFWRGVAIHAVWNFAFPYSALFHYLVFAYSCWLAFGIEKYPEYITKPFKCYYRFEPLRITVLFWRGFWLFPHRILRMKTLEKIQRFYQGK